MLTRVDVQSENPFYLNIRDARPTDSIIVEKIEGLDPPAVDLFLGEYARDGGFYSGRRVAKRNPVFHLILNPKYEVGETVSGLRELLYRSFMDPQLDGDYLNLVLKDDVKADRYIVGFVEKFEIDIFSSDLSVLISMLCPNPYILDSVETAVSGVGPSVPFVYGGTAESGVKITATLTAAATQMSILMNDVVITTLQYDFVAGDILFVNSRRGERQITVTRDGVVTDILYSQTATSKWIDLHKPSNVMKIYGNSPTDFVANITEIRFRQAWWGI